MKKWKKARNMYIYKLHTYVQYNLNHTFLKSLLDLRKRYKIYHIMTYYSETLPNPAYRPTVFLQSQPGYRWIVYSEVARSEMGELVMKVASLKAKR